jgi:hypothetical protein
MPVRIPPTTVRTEGLPGFYPDKHKYCHLDGATLKNDCFVSAPVVFNGTDRQLEMPVGAIPADNVIIGLCVRNQWNRLQVENDLPYRFFVKAGDAPYIMAEGEITMYAEKPLTIMYGQIFVRTTAEGANTRLYAISDTAGVGLVPLGNCRVVEISNAPGIVWVEARF